MVECDTAGWTAAPTEFGRCLSVATDWRQLLLYDWGRSWQFAVAGTLAATECDASLYFPDNQSERTETTGQT